MNLKEDEARIISQHEFASRGRVVIENGEHKEKERLATGSFCNAANA